MKPDTPLTNVFLGHPLSVVPHVSDSAPLNSPPSLHDPTLNSDLPAPRSSLTSRQSPVHISLSINPPFTTTQTPTSCPVPTLSSSALRKRFSPGVGVRAFPSRPGQVQSERLQRLCCFCLTVRSGKACYTHILRPNSVRRLADAYEEINTIQAEIRNEKQTQTEREIGPRFVPKKKKGRMKINPGLYSSTWGQMVFCNG